MTRGTHSGIVATAAFAAATIAAALADALAHGEARPTVTALVECLPALMLGVAAFLSARRGARLFGSAMMVIACGVVATSGTLLNGPVLVPAAVLLAGALLSAAFLRTAADERSRRRAVTLFVPLVVLASVLTFIAVAAGVSLSRTRCGVDNCGFTGLGIGLALGAAVEFMLLAVVVVALGADLRAGGGVVLFAAGLNSILAVAPVWSRYQGVAGVAVGYAGLGLAALPWLMPRCAKTAARSLPLPGSGL